MDHRGSRSRTSVDVVSDSPDELDERLGGLWDAVVGPHGVVKLPNQPCEAQLFLLSHTHTHTAVKLSKSPDVCAGGDSYAADAELSYGPLWQNRLRQHLDDQVAVVQRILVKGPVVVTLHLGR